MNTFLKTHLKLTSFSHRFFIKFHYFFGIDFRIDFSSFFDEKGSQNGPGKLVCGVAFSHLFRDLVFYVDFMLNLAHFGLTFGSRWLTFGSLLAPFGSLLAHFWRLLAHFYCLLVTFFVFLCIFDENDVQDHIFI